MLYVSRPCIGAEEIEEVKKVFDSRWLGLGSMVFEFEEKVKAYLGAKEVIAVNTGTSALHIALDAFGVGAGDEVIVPSLTFCATIQVITALKACPVFCEINPDTLNIDVEDVERRITPRTKAIIPVHYCGSVCDMEALLAIGQKRNILIIEDAAHAFGSSYKGKKVGSFGDAACFSFDPIKNITCGEGGAVCLSNKEVAEEIRKKRILGIDKDTWHRYANSRTWFYEVATQGYRYHMSNINAAIGLAQLKKIHDFIKKKRQIVQRYNKGLENQHGLQLLRWDLKETAPFSYIVKILDDHRENLMCFLKEKGVDTGIHYLANHTQPYFSRFAQSLPVTEKIAGEILTLPLYCDMSDQDADMVIAAIAEYFDKNK